MSPPYKFGGHKYFTSRDMFLVSQVNKEDHLINGSGGYYNTNPSRQVITVPNLVAVGTKVVEI